MSSEFDPNRPQCSLLLFVATSSEKEALKTAVKKRGLEFREIKNKLLGKYYWLGTVGNETVIAVRVEMGPLGRGGSAAKGILYQRATGAQGIVQLGMAFGINRKFQNHGDVLVSSSIIPYDNRDIRNDWRNGSIRRYVRQFNLKFFPRWFSIGQDRYTTRYDRATRQLSRPSLINLFQREQKRGGYTYNVFVGAMLSGAARIHCAGFRDELAPTVPAGDDPIIGGEMEGVGLLGVSIPDDPEPVWCVVKGISDFADEHRDTEIEPNRPIACQNAVEFVLSALENDARE